MDSNSLSLSIATFYTNSLSQRPGNNLTTDSIIAEDKTKATSQFDRK